jgi:hypothetical protein
MIQAKYDLRVILWTVRSDSQLRLQDVKDPEIIKKEGLYLSEAVEECRKQGIRLWAINNNPEQYTWSQSPKVYADYYIDDRGLGCPLIWTKSSPKAYANWNILGPKLDQICYERAVPKTITDIARDTLS